MKRSSHHSCSGSLVVVLTVPELDVSADHHLLSVLKQERKGM